MSKIYDVRVFLKDNSEWGPIQGQLSQELENRIIALANKEGVEIFLHRHKDADMLGGGASIHLECTPEFLEKVKTMPRFERADEIEFYGQSRDEFYRAWHHGPNKDSTLTALTIVVDIDRTLEEHRQLWKFYDAERDIFNYAYKNGFSNKVMVTASNLDRGTIDLLCPPAFAGHIEKIAPNLSVAPAKPPVRKPKNFNL